MREGHDGGPALFRLVRFWSRRWAGRASEELTGESRHVQHILVVEAVVTNASRAVAGEDAVVTVGTVAHQLGLDHSGASRMVRDAVEAGYLARATSERDRRRACLRLTESGEELLATARRWQRQAFDELTASWPEDDRRRFASYLRRLADDVGA
ncbi:MarR family winged helix-turn-helix transcriptional regulator [Sphaerisporangium sp. NPDC005289]|uniref:MarR family winged helix-turn-helix transcriptional regulator n=1 Tax=Sphaerisporangium sp. NPDC005289 TaxID=3155247 RepID=UPI0033B1B4EA